MAQRGEGKDSNGSVDGDGYLNIITGWTLSWGARSSNRGHGAGQLSRSIGTSDAILMTMNAQQTHSRLS